MSPQPSVFGTGAASRLVARLESTARTWLTPPLARRRRRLWVRVLVLVATAFLEMVKNRNYELDTNGEGLILRRLSATRPRCVFDVGANVGDWSAAAHRALPDATIHAFEIVEHTAQQLQVSAASWGEGAVVVNACGLSDAPGELSVVFDPAFSAGSSAAAPAAPGGASVQMISCPVTTGDAYCAQRRIGHVDLLKLDVEGLEERVLAGFSGMLAAGSIDAVQFEYGQVNADIRSLLADLYATLQGYGFVVGKIYPDGVEFRSYVARRDEDFTGPNFFAVRGDRDDLIDRLRV